MEKKLKIIEICPFSSGICGVWGRVMQESLEFTKLDHHVTILSSNIEKGSGNLACEDDNVQGISIKRFKSNQNSIDSIISKNVTYFNFEEYLQDLIINKQVDLVITHLLHPHSFKALKICIKNKIPCYLVTHAPFNIQRKFPLNLVTYFYNLINVKPLLNKFTAIIAITRWEYPYLKNLGITPSKIKYIPNGIPDEFIKNKIKPNFSKNVLFLGRIAPVKNLETLIKAAKLIPEIQFSVIGSSEKNYILKLNKLIKNNNISNVKFYPPIYNLKKKIHLIDKHQMFVLPSLREAMPQVLLEALSRGRIVLSSKTDGGKEILQDKKNGFLFNIGDYKNLARLITLNIPGNRIIQKKAIKDSKKYLWKNLIKPYITQFKNDKHNNNIL